MGLQDIDPFVDTPDGRAFFPYYRLAPGYLLAPSDEALLKRFLRRWRWAFVPFLMMCLLANALLRGHDLLVLLSVTALYCVFWLSAVRFYCRGLARTHGRVPALNITQRAAAALSDDFIEVAQFVCLLFAIGGAIMFWYRIGDPAIDLPAAVLFGGYWLWYCRIARMKRRERASTCGVASRR